jgi:hypothetical protein
MTRPAADGPCPYRGGAPLPKASFNTGLRPIPFDPSQGKLRHTQDAAQDAVQRVLTKEPPQR